MKVTIEAVTDWQRVLNAARWTSGKTALDKEPSSKFKTSILMAQHSPIRLKEYDIKIEGIPYCNAVHFVRHHIGCEKFQCSLRDDRNEEISDRKKLPQDYPVNLWINANAESIINISQKRLCCLAESTTRNIWHLVVAKIGQIDKELASVCVKTCIYRGFCPEMKSCGYADTERFKEQILEYRGLVKQDSE